MLFHSFQYVFLFLPLSVGGYFLLGRLPFVWAKLWLLIGSLTFYGYHNPRSIPLFLASMGINYLLVRAVANRREKAEGSRGAILLVRYGVALNIAFLGYFKYCHFFLENFNGVFSAHLTLPEVILPLAISFFTFQQIACLIDVGRGEARPDSFLDYCLFVAFFPQLIAGPILRAKQFLPQLQAARTSINYDNWAIGLYIFSLGLAKRVIIADTIGIWASLGYEAAVLSPGEAWITSLAYTLQIYFDFSGYTDMAIGSALFFNIRLPANFNSPYLAESIQDFWRRWHITLSTFLRDYIYIPLGGNRRGEARTYLNILITFLLGGLWHGASWTFIVWGALHGVGLMAQQRWARAGFCLPRPVAILVTFLYVNVTWVFFRAESFTHALRILGSMAGKSGAGEFGAFDALDPYDLIISLVIATAAIAAVVLSPVNTTAIAERPQLSRRAVMYCGAALFAALVFMNSTPPTGFLYFDF